MTYPAGGSALVCALSFYLGECMSTSDEITQAQFECLITGHKFDIIKYGGDPMIKVCSQCRRIGINIYAGKVITTLYYDDKGKFVSYRKGDHSK
jgi:hypothetical protein